MVANLVAMCSKLMDRVITVEYAIRDDDRSDYNPDRRARDMSPDRGGYDRRRSPSPYRRERGSPDYGYRRDRDSPDYGSHGPNPGAKPDARGSPGYGRDESPANGRYRSRRSLFPFLPPPTPPPQKKKLFSTVSNHVACHTAAIFPFNLSLLPATVLF